MILLESLIERKFGRYSHLVHIMDVPMFSIYVDKKAASEEYIESLKHPNIQEQIKKIFGDARYQINKIGFPSMHANVVITNLNDKFNYNTGLKGDVAGEAVSGLRYMHLGFSNISTDVIVHEWAHLWMYANAKSFKEAVQYLYIHMRINAADKFNPEDILKPALGEKFESEILNDWVKMFEDFIIFGLRDTSQMWYIWKGRGVTPDLVKYLPQGLVVKNLILLKPIMVQDFHGRGKLLKPGADVYIEKGNTGWILGEMNQQEERFEVVLDGGFDVVFNWVVSNQMNLLDAMSIELKKLAQYRKEYKTVKYLSAEILNKLKRTMVGTFERFASRITFGKPYDEEKKLVEQWAEKYVYPKYLQILRDRKLIAKFSEKPILAYDFLWMRNDLKPADTSIVTLLREIKRRGLSVGIRSDLVSRSNFSGQEWEEHRSVMNKLNKWVTSYGMTNNSELWATAVEKFFELPKAHQKAILKLMELRPESKTGEVQKIKKS